MTAFEIVYVTFCDDCEITIVEDDNIPPVYNTRNPLEMHFKYVDEVWYCEAEFAVRGTDEVITINREYTTDTVATLSLFYNGKNYDTKN